MTQTKHTPTPWEVQRMSPSHKGSSRMIVVQAIHSPMNSSLAAIGTDNYPENEANAEFIIRACNSHDDLLAALEDTLEVYDYEGEIPLMPRKQAQAAIDKAKGVTP